MPTALVTGVTGQDGSYLAELLLANGYRVIGTVRPGCASTYERISRCSRDLELVQLDLESDDAVEAAVQRIRPDEIYNLAGGVSGTDLHADPIGTGSINGLAVIRLLCAAQRLGTGTRFCQASSSEIFGAPLESPQSESTPLNPRNPYGIAKASAHLAVRYYRDVAGLFAVSMILYNHESPRRGIQYVSRKISAAAAGIRRGVETTLTLGDLDARRDWSPAVDVVQAMWLALRASEPRDFVIASGKTHTVREMCDVAFRYVDLDYRDYIIQDKRLMRPPEPATLVGRPDLARAHLNWAPRLSFEQLVCQMVDADLQRLDGNHVSL